MPVVEVNGVALHYEIAGSGPALVMIHGLGSSARDWERQLGYFAEFRRVITVDLRGHGLSDKPPGPYSIDLFANDVAALMHEIEVGPADVVGISLGGMVAFQLAADHPELVKRLVAVNALPAFDLTTIGMRLQVQVRKLIAPIMGMKRMGVFLGNKLFPDPDMGDERALMAERWAENDPRAYRDSFAAILRWRGVTEEMAVFPRPILVISSDEDYVSVEEKEPYLKDMPTARMEVIDDARHAVPVERPDRFNDVLGRCLRS